MAAHAPEDEVPTAHPGTDEWGIDHRYLDASGTERTVAEDAIGALRERIGTPPPERAPSPLITRRGAAVPGGSGEIQLEDGTSITVEGTFGPGVPFGYHTFAGRDGVPRRLILSPGRCHLPSGRLWGWAVQLYAARSRHSWGIGDLSDLGWLARWSATQLRAGFLMVNPLHAPAPTFPQQPSPYFPASRRFRSPLYLAVDDIPGAAGVPQVEKAARAGRDLNSSRSIDRDAAWRFKLAALEAIWELRAAHVDGPELTAWRQEQGQALTEFATWCVLTEHFGATWRSWPSRYRDPRDAAVAAFADHHAGRVRFFAWLQWLTQRQLDAVGARLALIQDLPIGVDPNGADAWSWQDLLATDVTVGAPPDEFNTRGQDWGLPPFVPWRLTDAGYQPFIDTIRATIPAGGGLRVDHVMGLFRLWWVPGGVGPAEGAYVRYPAQDLLDIVALESHRAGALIVGEDLGTVEPGVREAMAERAMLSYRLLWFEEDDPAAWPESAMAAVTTHDLPTVSGLWDGSDLAAQQRLGLDPNIESTRAIRDRLAESGRLAEDADGADAVVAAHAILARAPARLLTATLDDAVAEPERPNMPGADDQRANWSLALPIALEDLTLHPLVGRVAGTLARAVAPTPPSADDPSRTDRAAVIP